MNLEQWDFYVIATAIIDERLGEQKTLRLSSLLKLNPIKTDYLNLKKEMTKSKYLRQKKWSEMKFMRSMKILHCWEK